MYLYIRLYRNIVGYLRWRLPALILLMVLVGLSEGLAVALLLPLLGRIGITQAPGQGAANAILERFLAFGGAAVGTTGILATLIAVATVQAMLFIALNWWTASAGRSYQRQRQSELFHALMRAKWEFFIGRKVGELTNAIVTESERLSQAFIIGLYLISAFIATCIYLAFALIIAWPITLALIACALLMTLSVTRLYRKSYAVGQSLTPMNAELQSALGEQISGIKIVKTTTSEGRAEANMNRLVEKLRKTNTLMTFFPSLVRGLFEFLAFVLLAGIFVFGKEGWGVAPANIIVVLALFVRLFPRITTVQVYLHSLNGYVHALDSLDRLQIAATAQAELESATAEKMSCSLPTTLAIKNVGVKFDEHVVLEDINLKIPIPGMIGIVGGSGAGKSTLVHALLGLVMPSSGSVTLGKYDLHSVSLHAWRRQIGYVPQETILFHASVRANLTLADPNTSDADIYLAAGRAHADDFIRALPQGYNTIIGDQGVKLSGGQRQRLGIARALLTKPILLLLDEAMSALDAESETDLLRTLEELRSQMGILIVAHRLGTVRTADSIYVLEAGRVVESGSWNELMARRTRLYALAEAQSLPHDRSLETN
jgi:ATP-binding cassette subfamily C protein